MFSTLLGYLLALLLGHAREPSAFSFAAATAVAPAFTVSLSFGSGHALPRLLVTADLIGVIFPRDVGPREVSEVLVSEGSPLAGQSLQSPIAKDLSVLGLVRSGKIYDVSSGSALRIQVGDSLLVLGDPERLQRLESTANAKRTQDS